MRVASPIKLSATERSKLLRIAHSQTAQVRHARRASIVLLCADELDNTTVAQLLDIDRIQVGRWRERYAQGGWDAVYSDLPRGGAKRRVDHAKLIELTTQTKPQAATQWSSATLAQQIGCSASTVQRSWRMHGLKPHRIEHFKVSRDPPVCAKA